MLEIGVCFPRAAVLPEDKDEGSKCVYCWKRMAKNEHEAGGAGVAPQSFRNPFSSP